MDDTYLLAWVLAVLSIGALVLLALVVLGAIVLRFRGGRPGRGLGTAAVLLIGFQVGVFIVLLESEPIFRAITLGLVGLEFITLLWRDRRVQAGALLGAVALPWTIVWGWYVLRMVSGAIDAEATTTSALFLAGAVPLAIGLGLMVAGDPLSPEPSAAAPAGQPGSRRIGSVVHVVLAPESIGPFPVSELAALVATVAVVALVGVVELPFPIGPIAQVAAGTLAGSEARILVRPARSRRAFEAFSWLGEWEMARVKAATGRNAPGTRRGAKQFLASIPATPENGWMRVELLLWLDRPVEAREAADAMPERTPYERFERAYAIDMADWIPGGTGAAEALSDAMAGLAGESEDMRLRAEVAMAIREARMVAAEGDRDDAIEPLLRVRDRLGARADGQLHRGPWRRFLPASVITAIFVTLIGVPFS